MGETNFDVYINKVKKSIDSCRTQFGMAREYCDYLDREYENCKHESNNLRVACKYRPDVYCSLENCPFLR